MMLARVFSPLQHCVTLGRRGAGLLLIAIVLTRLAAPIKGIVLGECFDISDQHIAQIATAGL